MAVDELNYPLCWQVPSRKTFFLLSRLAQPKRQLQGLASRRDGALVQ